MIIKKFSRAMATLLACTFLNTTALADRFANIEVKARHVRGNVYMLTGSGGNIGLLATPDGMLMVDNQFLPLADKIEDEMEEVVLDKTGGKLTKDSPALQLKYVVNTHYHGDHSGGNSDFGLEAPIFAHDNVRERLAVNDELVKASLPVVTYENMVNIYLGEEKIILTHFPSGHTDGDTVVFLKMPGSSIQGTYSLLTVFPTSI